MALSSTIYNVSVELNDSDRGVFTSFTLRVAMHPSETLEFMAARLLAYCLEYTEGIEMTTGLSDGDEPAIVVRDLTGRITTWVDIGLPDADRLHRASKLAERVAVYTHRDIRILLGQLEGKRIHRVEELAIYTFGGSLIAEFAEAIERRVDMTVSVTGEHIYLDVNGRSLEGNISKHHAHS